MDNNNLDSRFHFMQSDMNHRNIIIMRGLPGCGKSTRVKEFTSDEKIICSADKFFEDEKGNYNFDFEKLGLSHNYCRKKAKLLMQRQVPLVVIDNTNIIKRDLIPYVEMAVHFQYRIQIEEPKSKIWLEDILPYLPYNQKDDKHLEKMSIILAKKNIHGVPALSIMKMIRRYIPLTVEKMLRWM